MEGGGTDPLLSATVTSAGDHGDGDGNGGDGDDIYGRKISTVTNAEREMRKKMRVGMRIFTEMYLNHFVGFFQWRISDEDLIESNAFLALLVRSGQVRLG